MRYRYQNYDLDIEDDFLDSFESKFGGFKMSSIENLCSTLKNCDDMLSSVEHVKTTYYVIADIPDKGFGIILEPKKRFIGLARRVEIDNIIEYRYLTASKEINLSNFIR